MINNKIVEARTIDATTGEVLWQSQRASRVKYFDEDKGYLFWPNKQAVKMHKGFSLPEDLSDSDVARTYRLSLVTHTNSNLICYRSDRSIKAMDIRMLSKYLNISRRQTVSFINRMITKRIIGKVKVTVGNGSEIQYYLNPLYFFNGKWLNCNLYFLFKKDLEAYLPKWVRDTFEAGTENHDKSLKPQVETPADLN